MAQVFKLERRVLTTATGEQRQQSVCCIASLTTEAAGAKRLNGLVRQYWGIENSLHYRRDKTSHEDATRMTDAYLAQNMATPNNLIVDLVMQQGWRYLPHARRHYNGCLPAALKLVFQSPG